jgi:hypothetical protein
VASSPSSSTPSLEWRGIIEASRKYIRAWVYRNIRGGSPILLPLDAVTFSSWGRGYTVLFREIVLCWNEVIILLKTGNRLDIDFSGDVRGSNPARIATGLCL